MSYTEIFKIKMDGDVVSYEELKNSHRGAMLVWHEMAKRYLPEAKDDMAFYRIFSSEHGMKAVWDLAHNQHIPESHRIVMASTFDRVVVPKEDMPRVIEAMRQYSKDFDDPGHILAEADILEKMLAEEDTYGVCWNQTSVNADYWSRPDENSPDGEYRPYNVFKDSGHWSMFQDS